MSFSVPTFNLTCNIWRNASGPPAAPDVTENCNLAWGKRSSSLQGIQDPAGEPFMTLLLPVSTDIRSSKCGAGNDWVEVPAGSGRFYEAIGVDDIGKGFSNEHRAAVLVASTHFGNWPAPIP